MKISSAPAHAARDENVAFAAGVSVRAMNPRTTSDDLVMILAFARDEAYNAHYELMARIDR